MGRGWLIGMAGLLVAAPALADVKAGVDAWAKGDFKRAVEEWRAPALAGDADAQFNLGQAYKLGRGVPLDPVLAQNWFLKAARQGHLQAGDNYGLALYADNRKAEALPWLEKSVSRGEPRAQLVLATMLFNGDGVPRDPARAYALMTRASQQGLKSAGENLTQMDGAIAPEDRQRGTELARRYQAEQDGQRLAATTGDRRPPRTNGPAARPIALPAPGAYRPGPGARVPPPIPDTRREPAAPVRHPAPSPPAVAHRTPEAPAPTVRGNWRVQLGAFRDEGNARDQWSRVAGSLHGARPIYARAGAVVRLQAGPYAGRAEAARACAAVRVACNVIAP